MKYDSTPVRIGNLETFNLSLMVPEQVVKFLFQSAMIASVDREFALGKLKDVCTEREDHEQNINLYNKEYEDYLDMIAYSHEFEMSESIIMTYYQDDYDEIDELNKEVLHKKYKRANRRRNTRRIARRRSNSDVNFFCNEDEYDDYKYKQVGRYEKKNIKWKRKYYPKNWDSGKVTFENQIPIADRRNNESYKFSINEYRSSQQFNDSYDDYYDDEWYEYQRWLDDQNRNEYDDYWDDDYFYDPIDDDFYD